MATPGYDPYQTLWHLFHQSGSSKFDEKLTVEMQGFINGTLIGVFEDASAPFLDQFKTRMRKAGYELDPLNEPLARGLLECLDPHKRDESYVPPDFLRRANRRGIWDHFKGGVYRFLDTSSWASGNGELVIEYISMLHGTKHTRLAEQWCEVVKWPDGKYRSRFVYRGRTLQDPEPPFKVPSPV